MNIDRRYVEVLAYKTPRKNKGGGAIATIGFLLILVGGIAGMSGRWFIGMGLAVLGFSMMAVITWRLKKTTEKFHQEFMEYFDKSQVCPKCGKGEFMPYPEDEKSESRTDEAKPA